MNEISLPASTGTLTIREEAHETDSVCTVVDARLEARNSFALKRYLQDRLKTASGRVILDLSAVEFIDSSGLGALIGGLKAASRKEAFICVRPAAVAMTVFRLTRTEALFVWADSRRVALSPAT